MMRMAPGFGKAIRERTPGAVELREEPSLAFPGTKYHWGRLHPDPDEYLEVTAVAVIVGDSLVVLARDNGFGELIEHISMAARRRADPEQVCAEAIRTTGSRRHFVWSPQIYAAGTTLTDYSLWGRPLPPGRISPPSVQRTGASWSVTAWFFEIGRTVRYRCTYDPTSALIEIVEEEAIPGFGLPDVGH
jgi:hypothetical protein